LSVEFEVTREDIRIAWLTALALGMYVLEMAFPSPLPGFKPGLANIVTVAALVCFGWATAAWIALLRVLAGSLLAGTFLSPGFALSLSGALASLMVLGLAVSVSRKALSEVGYSLLAALAHMGGQIGAAYCLFIPHAGLFKLLPVLMSAALVFGLLNGIIARSMTQALLAK